MRINEVYKPIVWYIAIVNDVYQPIYKLGGPHKAKWFRSKTGWFLSNHPREVDCKDLWVFWEFSPTIYARWCPSSLAKLVYKSHNYG